MVTSQPPPYPAGPPGGWDQPPAGTDWSPPGGYGHPQQAGYPGAGYPQGGYDQPQPGYSAPGYSAPGYPPPGYQQPAYPQSGYPQPDHPPPGPSSFGSKPGTNGLAIAALIFGIIGGSLLGIIFGIIALRQIRRTGQNGRGLAIAGLILSGIWIVVVAIVVVIALTTTAQRDPVTGTVAAGGDVAATSLQVGDCVNNLRDSTNLLSLPAVPCAQPHEGEVFAVFDLPAGPFPGADAVKKTVTSECSSRFAPYAPHSTDPDPGLFSVYPQQQNWDDNDRQVVCIATPGSGGTSTGSIRGS